MMANTKEFVAKENTFEANEKCTLGNTDTKKDWKQIFEDAPNAFKGKTITKEDIATKFKVAKFNVRTDIKGIWTVAKRIARRINRVFHNIMNAAVRLSIIGIFLIAFYWFANVAEPDIGVAVSAWISKTSDFVAATFSEVMANLHEFTAFISNTFTNIF